MFDILSLRSDNIVGEPVFSDRVESEPTRLELAE
jgi:hypothetical protein